MGSAVASFGLSPGHREDERGRVWQQNHRVPFRSAFEEQEFHFLRSGVKPHPV